MQTGELRRALLGRGARKCKIPLPPETSTVARPDHSLFQAERASLQGGFGRRCTEDMPPQRVLARGVQCLHQALRALGARCVRQGPCKRQQALHDDCSGGRIQHKIRKLQEVARQGRGQDLPSDGPHLQQRDDRHGRVASLLLAVRADLHGPQQALLDRLRCAGSAPLPIASEEVAVAVLREVGEQALQVRLAPLDLPGRRPPRRAHGRRHRRWPGAGRGRAGGRRRSLRGTVSGGAPLEDGAFLVLRILANVGEGLGLLAELLHDPPVLAKLAQALNLELHFARRRPAEHAALRAPGAQVGQAVQALRRDLAPLGCRIERAADGFEDLASALQEVVLKRLFADNGVAVLAIDPEQLAEDKTDNLRAEDPPQVQVTDELHVGKDLVLPLLHLQLKVVRRVLALLLLARVERRGQGLELLLASVQQHPREGLRPLALPLRRELGVPRAQGKHHVGIRLAVVGLRQCLAENNLDDELQLIGLVQLDLGEAVDDRLEVVGADLVEEAADPTLELVLSLCGLRDAVASLGDLEKGLVGRLLVLLALLHVDSEDRGAVGRLTVAATAAADAAGALVHRRALRRRLAAALLAGPQIRVKALHSSVQLVPVAPPNAQHEDAVELEIVGPQRQAIALALGDHRRRRDRRDRAACLLHLARGLVALVASLVVFGVLLPLDTLPQNRGVLQLDALRLLGRRRRLGRLLRRLRLHRLHLRLHHHLALGHVVHSHRRHWHGHGLLLHRHHLLLLQHLLLHHLLIHLGLLVLLRPRLGHHRRGSR
mmetsp:Transcript_1749/g.4992  ORF Transcript_1749/g.4992 Transcript_1749/m.4992 type:complete len:772 (+) Transcript_1749:27-2342(+)